MVGLAGTNVCLGVTGSIAAVRAIELAHELRRRGASVRAVMTDAATGIVHSDAVAYATDAPVVTELTGAAEHVALCGEAGWADVLVVAPATANTVGKIAAAIDDTPVTTCATVAIGAELPVVVAPAMHEPMYDHPGVAAALETLSGWEIDVLSPRIEEGKAKIPTDEATALAAARAAGPRPLAGRDVVVTSGATSEPVDPIRVLTSRASGRTGRAVARGCYVRGADVTLLHDDAASVPYATVESVETAAEMTAAAEAAAGDADALVSAAAISDYAVESPADEKLPSGRPSLTLSLSPTPKLLDAVRAAHPDLPMVGFKLETGGEETDAAGTDGAETDAGGTDDEGMEGAEDEAALLEAARELRDRVDLSFVVANDAAVMGAAETAVTIVREGADTDRFEGTKARLGLRVADELARVLDGD